MYKLLSVFKALSDGNRLRVFTALLIHEELCACQIKELLQVTGATASRHMGVLLAAGLIKSRKEGRWVYYRLNSDNPSFSPVLQWIQEESERNTEVGNDRELLKEITSCEPEDLCSRQRGD